MKIKEKFKSIIENLKKVFGKFPISIITIALYSIFIAVALDKITIPEEICENIILFVLYFVSATILIETLIEKIDKKKIIFYILAIAISICLIVVREIFVFQKISICYVATLLILSVYYLFKKSEKDFKEYTIKVLTNCLKVSIIYGILAIGILIISSIFNYLIWEKGGSLEFKLEYLLLGLYYIPQLMYCFANIENEEVHSFFKCLIKYVLNSLVVISFVIIYMYMIKILILRDIPKNQIFRILSALFIVGMPIWTMTQYFKDESLWYKISLKLPIAFIPFIFLQIYTIGIRIANNGLTPLRYVCVALIIFEIIYSIIYIVKKEKIQLMLLVFNGIIIVSLIVPGINMITLSNISQSQNLKMFKSKQEYTNEEKDKIYSSYIYLKSSKDGKKYIDKILNVQDISKIKEFKQTKIKDSDFEYIQAHTNISDINIEGYKKLYVVNAREYSEKEFEETFENLELKKENERYSMIEIDVLDEFEKYIEVADEEDLNNYLEENNEIQIDENTKFIIKSFYMNYSKDSNIVKNYYVKGYLLER